MKQKNMGLISSGKGFSRILLAAGLLLFTHTSQAQTIVGASFADNVLATGVDARNVNCDMVYNALGGHLRAVAYDDFTTGNGFVRLDDFAGGTITIPIPGGLFPDVVIGDDLGSPGVNYILGIVYGASTTSFRTYSIMGTGSGALNAILTSSQMISTPGSPTSRFPHIDLHPDVYSSVWPVGFPTLHDFVITWSEDFGGGMDIYATTGDLMAPLALSPSYAITAGGTGMMSDVAALFDKPAGQPYAYIPYFNTATNDLDIAELDINAGTFTVSTGIDNPIQSLPRIDAMNLYDAFSGIQHYQVAYPKHNGTNFEMWSYNDLTGNTDLSSAGFGVLDNMHPAVAAGPGPLYGVPAYGNDNYAVAWHLPGATRYVAQSINPFTGGISGIFPNYYITNLNPMVSPNVPYHSPVAISTSTNTGTRLLTAWAGNGRVWYKYNSNTASYKTTGVDDVAKSEKYALYPNPATTQLHIDGITTKGSYTIADMAGRILQQGNLDNSDNTINIGTLANGMYVASINEGEVITLIKFTRQ